jgi:hypothetical protein
MLELIVFLAFFSVISGAVTTILLSTNDNRMRQNIIQSVDAEGLRMIQHLSGRARRAESIFDPPLQESGSILALHMPNEYENPTIFALQTGALISVEHDTEIIMHIDGVSITDFHVQNTSASEEKQSLYIQLTVEKSIVVPFSFTHTRTFDAIVSLFPSLDEASACNCTEPSCNVESYLWQVCESGDCFPSDISLVCGKTVTRPPGIGSF